MSACDSWFAASFIDVLGQLGPYKSFAFFWVMRTDGVSALADKVSRFKTLQTRQFRRENMKKGIEKYCKKCVDPGRNPKNKLTV